MIPALSRARDLQVGDVFQHRSLSKIPGTLTVGSVETTLKGKVLVVPAPPWNDYRFTFWQEQRVTILKS